MRLVKPTAKPAPERSGRASSTARKGMSRPEWFKEWLANQGRYVELACGHIVDANDHGQCEVRILNAVFPGMTLTKLYCWTCEGHQDAVRGATFSQYMGIPKPEPTQEPLF